MLLHSVSYGDGDVPVVFLGSIASTTDMWLPQLDALSGTRRVIALDHRGHGNSPDPAHTPGQTTFEDLVADVHETLDDLGVGDYDVVGLSLGGALAQHLAATDPRVRRAAFLCTATSFGGEKKWRDRAELTRTQGMTPMVDAVVGLWVSTEFSQTHPATTDFYRRMVASTRGSGYAECAEGLARFDSTPLLGEITCPVLTIAGDQDESTPPAALEQIARGVGGDSQQVVVQGGHVPTVESADAVNSALKEFLTN
ncbi:alpha/beta fold hydrolase [Corynebacterium tapiri]|uniref:Alpha/beta fold hydrolase n=1 Tax=Corynebacterium tapiri TaxID=1448266 RepID=A0A5C4U2P1_9CORY|nr:alpha/beta fold hydrolase [Corynebacterium tapiri]TNL96661.1 alpha/beta fold hydrolase [Corynebacterium tapiri]